MLPIAFTLAALTLGAFVLSGCEDEDGKDRPIAAIVIRQIIFAKAGDALSSDQLPAMAPAPAWVIGAGTSSEFALRDVAVSERGYVQIAPDLEALPIAAAGEFMLTLTSPPSGNGSEETTFTLLLLADDGDGLIRVVATGESVTCSPATGVRYAVAIVCTHGDARGDLVITAR